MCPAERDEGGSLPSLLCPRVLYAVLGSPVQEDQGTTEESRIEVRTANEGTVMSLLHGEAETPGAL